MEIFKNNLKEAGFTEEFIKQALQYFTELEKEKEIQELNNLGEVIDYFARVGSYTCNSLQSELNLRYFRKDLYLLHTKDYNDILNFNLYFENIEEFELQVLYTLFFEFYPQEEEEEK